MKIVADGNMLDAQLEPGEEVCPCPFCGGDDIALEHTWTACYAMKCKTPDCEAEITGRSAQQMKESDPSLFGALQALDRFPEPHLAAARDALARWNRRPPISVG